MLDMGSKKKFRKYLKIFNNIILISAVIFAVFFTYNFGEIKDNVAESVYDSGFRVEEIHINELEFLHFKEIVDNLSFEYGDAISQINIVADQKKLKENFWIDDAFIKIIYPNIVLIEVVEKKPQYVWFHNNKYFALDHMGKVIKEIDDGEFYRFSNYVVVTGEKAYNYIYTLVDFINSDEEIYSYIEELNWVGNRRWDIKFINGMVLKMPQENIIKAWQEFLQIDKKLKVFSNRFKTIDLRVKDRVFLELDSRNKRIIEEVG